MKMNVKELIEKLEAIEDKDKEVAISIYQYNKAYPIAHTRLSSNRYLNQTDSEVRLSTWLPDNVFTVKRKNALK